MNNNDQLLVKKEAKLSVLVYEDYECEYLGKAFMELKALREYFKEKFRNVYTHFLCTSIHPSGLLADLPTQSSQKENKSNSRSIGRRLIGGKEQISSLMLVLLNKSNSNEE